MTPEDNEQVYRALNGPYRCKPESLNCRQFTDELLKKIDLDGIYRDIILGVLAKLGSFADDWYFNYSSGHYLVYNPHFDLEHQGEVSRLEKIVKRKLGLITGPIFQPLSNDPYWKNELKSFGRWASGEDQRRPWESPSWQRFPEVAEDPHVCSYCSDVPELVMRALVRSGKYLLPGVKRDPNLDLGVGPLTKVD